MLRGEEGYLELMREVMMAGDCRETRNGKVYSLFGRTLEFNLQNSFPLLTTKKVFFRGIIEELIFFLSGKTDTNLLEERKVNIWRPNTCAEFLKSRGLNYATGDMGPMYGFNWIHYGAEYRGCWADYWGKGFNQLEQVMKLLKTDPMSRRIIMTSYNPVDADKGVLYPCHGIVIQFYVRLGPDGGQYLSCSMTQRSADIACGLPYNIASYAALVYLLCKHLDFKPDRLIIHLGDVHMYEEHLPEAAIQIAREPRPFPKISLKEIDRLTEISYEHFVLDEYNPWPALNYVMKA